MTYNKMDRMELVGFVEEYKNKLLLLKIKENNFIINEKLKEEIANQVDGDYIEKLERTLNWYKRKLKELD